MHLLLVILTLLGACEALVPNHANAHKHQRRATTTTSAPPVYQTGIACNCNKYHVVVSGDTCDGLVTLYENTFTLAQFYSWNPAVGSDCKYLGLGYSVCIGVNTAVTKCTTTTTTTTTAAPTPTTTSKSTTSLGPYSYISETVINAQPTPTELQPFGVPSPVQSGIYSGCETYYQAKTGDNCTTITDYFFGFNQAQFISWNPAVSYDCSKLVVGNYYCVQASTYQPPPAIFSGPGLPSPLPNCTVSDCTAWYRATETDNCTTVPQTFGNFSLVEFTQWNTFNPNTCKGFDVGYYYCINWPWSSSKNFNSSNFNDTDYSTWRFPENSCFNSTGNGTTTVPPTSTTTTTTTASPTSACLKTYTVVSGDSCATIQATYGITFAQLYAWNPSIGSNCEYLAIGNTYCVSKSTGSTTTTTTTTATPTSACLKTYTVVSGDSCAAIQATYGITFAQLYAWNPSIGSNCEYLAIGNTYCVSKSTGTTTTTSSQATPTTACTKTYTIVSGDSCAALQSTYGISFAQLYAWNPSIGSNCQFLAIGNSYCVAKCTKNHTVVSGDSCAAVDSKYGITFAQLYAWNPSVGSNCEFLAIGNTYCVAQASS